MTLDLVASRDSPDSLYHFLEPVAREHIQHSPHPLTLLWSLWTST